MLAGKLLAQLLPGAAGFLVPVEVIGFEALAIKMKYDTFFTDHEIAHEQLLLGLYLRLDISNRKRGIIMWWPVAQFGQLLVNELA